MTITRVRVYHPAQHRTFECEQRSATRTWTCGACEVGQLPDSRVPLGGGHIGARCPHCGAEVYAILWSATRSPCWVYTQLEGWNMPSHFEALGLLPQGLPAADPGYPGAIPLPPIEAPEPTAPGDGPDWAAQNRRINDLLAGRS